MPLTDPGLLSTALLGIVAGVVGSFAVLRRRALLGDLISHTALPGLCVAFLIVGQASFLPMLAGAFVAGLLGLAAVTAFTRYSRTKEDAAIGIVLSTFFGGGAVLSSMISRSAGGGGKAGLEHYIYGQAAAISGQDLLWIEIVSGVALAVVILCYKEFKVFSFDPDFAAAQGWPTLWLETAFLGTLALVTVVGLQAVGVVLMAAMLITPAAAARYWSDRLGKLLILAGIIGGMTGLVGTAISAGTLKPFFEWIGFDPLAFGYNKRALPLGPVIVLTGTAIFLFSMLFAPRRGVLARVLDGWRLRRKIADENLLRSLYDLSEPLAAERPAIATDVLARERGWTGHALDGVLRRALKHGWITIEPSGVRLTPAGMARAAQITRAHRLWELFLIDGANIAVDHVDRDADAIEHVLPPEIVDQLEARLAAAGKLPVGTIPKSPHPLEEPAHA